MLLRTRSLTLSRISLLPLVVQRQYVVSRPAKNTSFFLFCWLVCFAVFLFVIQRPSLLFLLLSFCSVFLHYSLGLLSCILSTSHLSPLLQDEEKAKFTNEILPRWLGYFEKFLKNNNGGHGWLVGNNVCYSLLSSSASLALFTLINFIPHYLSRSSHSRLSSPCFLASVFSHLFFFFSITQLTYADIALYYNLSNAGYNLDHYPLLKAHQERVASRPNIAAWVASRPVSQW